MKQTVRITDKETIDKILECFKSNELSDLCSRRTVSTECQEEITKCPQKDFYIPNCYNWRDEMWRCRNTERQECIVKHYKKENGSEYTVSQVGGVYEDSIEFKIDD